MKVAVRNVFDAYGSSELDYLLRRLGKFRLYDFPSTNEYAGHVASLSADAVSVVPEQDLPSLSGAKASLVAKAIDCARKQVYANYPLLPGESIKGEHFSYLAAPYRNEPAGTGLLHQETTFADIYFFFDNTRVEGDRITYVSPARVLEKAAPPRKLMVIDALALALGKALVSGIGSKIGAAIGDQLLKAMGFDYVQPTAEVIKGIVHDELTSAYISQINGQIDGTKQWISSVYLPLKQRYQTKPDPRTLSELRSGLNDYANDLLTKAIGVLRQDQYAKVGFGVYLVAVPILLSLYQELALIDENVKRPEDSPYADTVKLMAKSYADFGDATYTKLKDDRLARTSMAFQPRVCSYAGGYATCSEAEWYWQDSYTQEYHGFGLQNKDDTLDNAKARCDAEWEPHKQAALTRLDSDLSNAGEALQCWHKLETQPIPVPAK